MTDYVKLQDTAQRLISQFGMSCVLSKIVNSEYDPELNKQNKIINNYPLKGVSLSRKSSEFTSELVKTGEILFLLEAKDLTVTPSVDDKIIISSISWSIISIHAIQPANIPVYYEMILRK